MLNWIKSLDRVLKGEATRPAELRDGSINVPVGGLTVVLLVLAGAYGACMGAFAIVARWNTPTRHDGFLQIAYSAAKVPMLFFLTLIVTFPSLYVFNALVGSRLRFTSVLRLLIASLGVTLAVLASFGTIVLFFSLCTTSYSFMVLLNVALFTVAGLLGMRFLLQTLQRMSVVLAIAEVDPLANAAKSSPKLGEPTYSTSAATASLPTLPPPIPGALDRLHGQAPSNNVKTVFRVWVLVFGLVGAQMSWVLRPFIGNPAKPVAFFRQRDGNFFEAVADRAIDLVAGPTWRHPNGRIWSNDSRNSTTAGESAQRGGVANTSYPAAPATSPVVPTTATSEGRQ